MQNNKPGSSQIWFWVINKSRSCFLTILLLALVVTVFELSIPFLLEQIINEAIKDLVDLDAINQFGLTMFTIIVCIYLTHHIYVRFEVKMLCQISYNLSKRLYDHLMAQPIAYFKRKNKGEILHRITSDTNVFEKHCHALLSELPYEFLIVVGVIGMMIYLDATLAMLVIGFLIATSVISAKIGRPLPTLERRVQILGARLSNRLHESLHGIKTIKTYGTEQQEIDQLDEANKRRVEVKRTTGRVESYLLPIFDLMEILGVVIVVWYGAHLILEDRLTVGGLVAFIAYMEYLAGPVSRAGKYYQHMREATGIAQRMAEFLHDSEIPPEQFAHNVVAREAPQKINSVKFNRVSFRYPKNKAYTLKNVTFQAKRGEIVALVGRNGAGKSTTMDLLLRLYSPDEGRILAADLDLRAWDQKNWRNSIGVMSQEVFLFNTTIRQNIAYGCGDVTNEQIEAAAEKAGVISFLPKLSKGLDSLVGEKGSKFSGGEKQKIALARLFLRNPPIIVYDEPTAAMDGEAAKDIARTIQKLATNRISIIIAHQAEMVAISDRVVLFDNGEVVDTGSHAQLFRNNSLYRNLFETLEHKNNYEELSHNINYNSESIEAIGN